MGRGLRGVRCVVVAVAVAGLLSAVPAVAQAATSGSGSASGLGADFEEMNARLGAINAGKARKLETLADCIRWARTDDGQALRVLAIGVLSSELFTGQSLFAPEKRPPDPAAIRVDSVVVAIDGRRVTDIPAGEEHKLPFRKSVLNDETKDSRLVTLRVRVGGEEQDRTLVCNPFDETLGERAAARAKELGRDAAAELRAALEGMTDDEVDKASAGLASAVELLKSRPKDGVGFGPRHRLEVPGQYVYEGQVRDGKPHGEGTITFPQASASCTGEFIDGVLPRGRCGDGKNTYEGELKQFLPHGKGVSRVSDGSRHEGLFADGKPHGAGVHVAKNGTRVEGTWTRGELSGDIVARYADGWTYRGPYAPGNATSRPSGRYYDSNGRLMGEAPFFLEHPT